MNKAEVNSIVIRVLGGETDAYEDLIRGYQQEVWRVVSAMLLNAQKTEDLVQQTFITAFQQLHRYECDRVVLADAEQQAF